MFLISFYSLMVMPGTQSIHGAGGLGLGDSARERHTGKLVKY